MLNRCFYAFSVPAGVARRPGSLMSVFPFPVYLFIYFLFEAINVYYLNFDSRVLKWKTLVTLDGMAWQDVAQTRQERLTRYAIP